MSIILYAIPGFFLLIAIELVAEKLRKTNYYRINDAITSLSIGVLSRVFGVLKALVPLTIYAVLHEHFNIVALEINVWTWLVIFIAYDFFYYWNHRFGHEVSLFWAAHVVHHSSEDYNLTTALRQTSGSFFNFIFFVPLAFLGVDPITLVSVASVNLVYQFWVHTQHIPKLGWLEWIFITPSNHRVHHAQNQIYLDKNYGGVFIIWDRIFGTFQEELADEKPIYGVRKALKSWNPLYANIQVYKQLIKDSFYTASWLDKLRVWFGKTGWRPDDVSQRFPMERVDLSKFETYDTKLSPLQKCYAMIQYVFNAGLALYLLLNLSKLSVGTQVALAALIIFSSVSLALYMENQKFAHWLEGIKILACLMFIPVANSYYLQLGLLIFVLVSLAILLRNTSLFASKEDKESQHQA
ncbi:sterol desaturase family protein [Glaciecola sp. KUL10]|uniref:sterol desaturase family protein n=1 Tax=Glaciecola sp. (strain KUL10) TaxID=2161813 RepID=UPI000D782FDD|nr:sterol desaturase family protein [Glaciecola sp. KUL10]GBL04306.1 sterol desaturase-like protein [Glaciecola sp. KUL10]